MFQKFHAAELLVLLDRFAIVFNESTGPMSIYKPDRAILLFGFAVAV